MFLITKKKKNKKFQIFYFPYPVEYLMAQIYYLKV